MGWITRNCRIKVYFSLLLLRKGSLGFSSTILKESWSMEMDLETMVFSIISNIMMRWSAHQMWCLRPSIRISFILTIRKCRNWRYRKLWVVWKNRYTRLSM